MCEVTITSLSVPQLYYWLPIKAIYPLTVIGLSSVTLAIILLCVYIVVS